MIVLDDLRHGAVANFKLAPAAGWGATEFGVKRTVVRYATATETETNQFIEVITYRDQL